MKFEFTNPENEQNNALFVNVDICCIDDEDEWYDLCGKIDTGADVT